MDFSFDKIAGVFQSSRNIVIVSGAGVSVSCGIPDFRSRNGLYKLIQERYPHLEDPQLLFDIHYFRHDQRPFFDLAKTIFPSNFTPSITHRFIKYIEDRGCLLRNYTQNIDSLELRAGIKNVLYCHGSFDKATCMQCGHVVAGDDIREAVMKSEIPLCIACPPTRNNSAKRRRKDSDDEDNASIFPPVYKPNIVFFGENIPASFGSQLAKDLEHMDLFVVIGSSLRVSPVNLVLKLVPNNVPSILINKTFLKHCYDLFDYVLLGDCDVIVSKLARHAGWNEFLDDNLVKRSENENFNIQFVHPNIFLFSGAEFDTEAFEKEQDSS